MIFYGLSLEELDSYYHRKGKEQHQNSILDFQNPIPKILEYYLELILNGISSGNPMQGLMNTDL